MGCYLHIALFGDFAMNRKRTSLAALALVFACSFVFAIWDVSDHGDWPKSWPKELEPLRKQSSTIQGSEANLIKHHIPFTKREEFEAAWPQLLKVKTKGAPIFLSHSPLSHWHFGEIKAGVLVHSPSNVPKSDKVAGPIAGAKDLHDRWMATTYIELIVDGEIVDLNRVSLPADTPIIDQRFEKKPSE
jgi:hypothetical protein